MTNHNCPNNKTIVHQGQLYTGCELCIGHKIPTGEYSAKFNREWQKGQYRRELAQPNELHKFVRAFGAEKAREHGYSDEQIRRYS